MLFVYLTLIFCSQILLIPSHLNNVLFFLLKVFMSYRKTVVGSLPVSSLTVKLAYYLMSYNIETKILLMYTLNMKLKYCQKSYNIGIANLLTPY